MIAVLTIEWADHSYYPIPGVTQILPHVAKVQTKENDQVQVSEFSKNGHIRLEMEAEEVKIKAGSNLRNGVGFNTPSLCFLCRYIKTLPTVVEIAVFMKECYNAIGKLK